MTIGASNPLVCFIVRTLVRCLADGMNVNHVVIICSNTSACNILTCICLTQFLNNTFIVKNTFCPSVVARTASSYRGAVRIFAHLEQNNIAFGICNKSTMSPSPRT